MKIKILGIHIRTWKRLFKEGMKSEVIKLRKSISVSLEEKVIEKLKARADKKHLSTSRELEDILRKALRI